MKCCHLQKTIRRKVGRLLPCLLAYREKLCWAEWSTRTNSSSGSAGIGSCRRGLKGRKETDEGGGICSGTRPHCFQLPRNHLSTVAMACVSCLCGADSRLGPPYLNDVCTVNVCRISHLKWRESKQQLIRLLDLTLLGCILVSFHILCVILLTFTVHIFRKAVHD